MNKVAKFEKVSFEQFYEDVKGCFEELVAEELFTESMARDIYKNVEIPVRATSGSAGYDIVSPIGFMLPTGCTMKIPTGIRVKIDDGWFLGCLPRSGLGFKYRLQLDNTMGIIDSDYYYSDNEGHIFLKVTNDSRKDKTINVHSGDKIAQGILLPYGIVYDDEATGTRNGGFGSTGK